MNLIKFNPFNPINTHSDVFEMFFNNAISHFSGADQVNALPSVNVIEREVAFTIELAAPGLQKDDFAIYVENDRINIEVEKKNSTEEEDKTFKRREFNYTSFKRSFKLDDIIDKDQISAVYESGVLKVNLPKMKQKTEENTRTIEIS